MSNAPHHMKQLRKQLASVTTASGVYLMKDATGAILYVGKARNLKKRLRTYFQNKSPRDSKTQVLVSKIATFDTMVTHTEKEALILESNLIKRHRPRYNVVLKDDKRYPSLRLDMAQPFPNLTIVRKILPDGALYFGPYASSSAVRQTLKFIHKTFRLRKCHNRTFANRTRPCLNYQMGLCLGPCCNRVEAEQYHVVVQEVIAFLKGRTPELVRQVRQEMKRAADRQAFEKAAALRDKMMALEKTLERQVSVASDFKDRDVIAMVDQDQWSVATLLRVRNGFLMGSHHYHLSCGVDDAAERMSLFIRQYYHWRGSVPPEILCEPQPADSRLIQEQLSEMADRRVHLLTPKRGEKVHLLRMAIKNAREELRDHALRQDERLELMTRLGKRLQMKTLPTRIECFDNSNLVGTEPVAAMAVFVDGEPSVERHRRYRIKTVAHQDDYAYMAEVLRRRLKDTGEVTPFPDLLLVDGGKGQLNVALEVMSEMGMAGRFSVAGIAKKDEQQGELQDKIYLPGRANPVNFTGRDADLLLVLQRVRDEAHRLAVTFQRKRRSRRAMVSQLDAVPGIGPKRRRQLMRHFGSVKKIRAATVQQISALPGISELLARNLKSSLAKRDFR